MDAKGIRVLILSDVSNQSTGLSRQCRPLAAIGGIFVSAIYDNDPLSQKYCRGRPDKPIRPGESGHISSGAVHEVRAGEQTTQVLAGVTFFNEAIGECPRQILSGP